MGGRLLDFWEVWDTEFLDQFVTGIVRKGYRIPFHRSPPMSPSPVEFQSYNPGSERFLVLDELVQQMLLKGATEVVQSPSPGFYSRMFVVPKITGGWRPIIDLSPLNKFVAKEKFSMECPRTVLLSLQKSDWLTSIDLQDAYFHIPIHKSSRPYLRFQWRGTVYQFRALCFGLSTAPFIFTRVFQPVSVWAHTHGIRLTRYLDDWLIAARDFQTADRHTQLMLHLCKKIGLIVNLNKSDLVPCQRLTYLGMDIDTASFLVRPTEVRLRRLDAILQSFSQNTRLPAISFLRLIGHMVSLEKLIPGARIRLRSLQFHLKESWNPEMDYGTLLSIPQSLLRDLEWWQEPDHRLQGQPIHEMDPDFLLFTDASKDGWGAHLDDLRASGLWSETESLQHINCLELKAVWLGLQSFLSTVEDSTVLAMSDNTTVVGYIRNKGGTKSDQLNQLTSRLLRWSEDHGINLLARHIPGSRNTLADALSRRAPVASNWSLNPSICRRLWRLWGQPHLDLFATSEDTRLPVYVSPFPDPQAWAVDALAIEWSSLWAYAFPPFSLLPAVLRKVREGSSEVILVAPNWPAKPWFPDLLELLIDLPRELPLSRNLLRQGRRSHDNLAVLHLHAWRLSGSPSERQAFLRKQPLVWQDLSDDLQKSSTSPNGQSTLLGVVRDRQIHAVPLYPH